MSLFRTGSSSTFITSDVRSIYIPSSIQDWYREDKISATDRQYSFCLWILWTKNISILTRSTWKHRVLHNTCTKHGRNIKIRFTGLTSTLLWRRDWSSTKHDRTLSFFTIHSQPIVSRKLSRWKLETSYTRRYMRHLGFLQRFPWNMTGWKIGVQKLLDNQKEKLRDKQKVPNQANQTKTQIMIERWNLLFALKKERPKHVFLVTARTSMWKTKQITIERWNLLFAVVQITSAQCWTRLTSTSEYLDCHILLWNKLIFIVFVNSWSRSRTTPHRQSLQRDLQQNNAYNPFSEKSKKMIQDMGNVELFELFETEPETQCKECLLYWNLGIMYFTCGHLL